MAEHMPVVCASPVCMSTPSRGQSGPEGHTTCRGAGLSEAPEHNRSTLNSEEFWAGESLIQVPTVNIHCPTVQCKKHHRSFSRAPTNEDSLYGGCSRGSGESQLWWFGRLAAGY